MTDAQKVSAIKRINERLAEMGRQFGKDSGIYRDYKNAILLAIPEEALTRSGTISHGAKALDVIDDQVLDDLLAKHTAGQVKKVAREEAKRESEETGEPVSVDEYLEAMDYVYTVINDDPDEAYEAFETYWSIVGRGSSRPSYTVLRDIIETKRRADQEYDLGNKEAADNIENKLFKRLEQRNKFNAEDLFT